MPNTHNQSLNFDLLIDKHENGYRARVIQGPAGEEKHDFVLPFSESELRAFLELPNHLYRHLRLSPQSIDDVKPVDPQSFGKRLFKAVFTEGIYTSLMRSIDEARRQNALLRIRLRMNEVPELAILPWEYLFNPVRDQFLVLSADVALMRYMDLPEANQSLEVKLPLRVLVMVSDPDDAPRLAVEQEWVRLQEALKDLVTTGKLVLERLPAATSRSLQRQLRQGDYHIFHFIGHGWFDEQAETSGLLFEDEQGNGVEITARQLGVLLEGHRSIRLAFLNACEGARVRSGAAFSGTAQYLVRQNLLAVIAMQFRITDSSAIYLSHEFYQALVDSSLVDKALTEARKAVYVAGSLTEWALPVLFMRSSDGRLFQLEGEQKRNFANSGDAHWVPQIEILPPPEPKRPPTTAGFVGREVELAYYAGKLSVSNLTLITGIAGVGKTALAVKLAEQSVESNKLFWHRFEEGDNVKVVILRLAGFLAYQGHDELWRSLERERQNPGSPRPIETILDYLLQGLSRQGYLLCLDDLQFVDEDREHQQLMEQLLALASSGELKLIITSQRVPDFLSKWNFNFNDLEGLTIAETQRLLSSRGVDLSNDLAAKLNKYTGGNVQIILMALDILRGEENPVEIINHLAETDNIQTYLMQQIYRRLNEQERRVMSAVAALLGDFGTQKMIETILAGSEVSRSQNVLHDLSRRHLLISTKEKIPVKRGYSQHAMIQAFYYERTDKVLQREMHRKAANFYESEEGDPWKAIRQYERAKEFAKVAELASTHIWKLTNQGHIRSLLEILEHLRQDQFSVEQWIAIGITKGEIYIQLFERKAAYDVLETTLQQLNTLPSSPKVNELKIRTLSRLASAVLNESPQQALELCQLGLDLAIADNLIERIAELKLQIGQIQIDTDHYNDAIGNIQFAVEHLPDYLKIEALTALSAVHIELGDMERSIEYARQALTLAQELNDDFDIVHIQIHLALYLYYSGSWSEAVTQLQKALEIATRLGSISQYVRLILNLGVIYLNMGNDRQAQENLNECIEKAPKYGFSELKINALSSLADLYLRRGEVMLARPLLTEAEAMALVINDQDLLAEIYRNWATLHLNNGDPKLALETIERSIKIARDIGAKLEEGMSLRTLADVGTALSYSFAELLPLYEQSLVRLHDDLYESARTKARWGQVLLHSPDSANRKTLLQEAQSTFEKLGAKRDLQETEHLLADI